VRFAKTFASAVKFSHEQMLFVGPPCRHLFGEETRPSPESESVHGRVFEHYGMARPGVERTMPLWTWLIPVLSLALLLAALAVGVGTLLAVLCGAALAGAVIVAVHHAEVVAHRVGEPLGTLVLALWP
jgi:hypothetical protein